MSWPIVLPNGWRINEMKARRRGYHVRKHLLAPPERWHELTSLSIAALKGLRGRYKKAGLPYGASLPDQRGAPTTDDTRLYDQHYRPVALAAILAALEGTGDLLVSEEAGRSRVSVRTRDCLYVAASGRGRKLRWKTAFRLTGTRAGDSLEQIYRRHVRSERRRALLDSKQQNRGHH